MGMTWFFWGLTAMAAGAVLSFFLREAHKAAAVALGMWCGGAMVLVAALPVLWTGMSVGVVVAAGHPLGNVALKLDPL
ncbi:MAG: hypothetical protein PHQ27_08165, partial [Victivallales bacterium]|nr:hypothetical protein [Victivallales bacterium]